MRFAGALPGRNPGNLTFCWIFATTRSVSRVISSTGTVISISCLQPSRSIGCGMWAVGRRKDRFTANQPHFHPTTHYPQPTSFLCTLVPACQVMFLLGSEAIDFYAH